MVRQEREHPALIWQQAYDPFEHDNPVFTNWELVRHMPVPPRGHVGIYDFVVYATINKVGDRKWVLRLLTPQQQGVNFYTFTTLKAAKAMGIVLTQFDNAG